MVTSLASLVHHLSLTKGKVIIDIARRPRYCVILCKTVTFNKFACAFKICHHIKFQFHFHLIKVTCSSGICDPTETASLAPQEITQLLYRYFRLYKEVALLSSTCSLKICLHINLQCHFHLKNSHYHYIITLFL
jgi:hypothetical protein